MHADHPTAQDRLAQVADHLSGAKQAGKQALLQKHPDDVGPDQARLRYMPLAGQMLMLVNRLSSLPRSAHPSPKAAKAASKTPRPPTSSTASSRHSSNAPASTLLSSKISLSVLSLPQAAVQPNSALPLSPPAFPIPLP